MERQNRWNAGLDRICRLHDHVNAGMTVGAGANTVCMSKCEYADDAALIDENAGQAAARVTSLATGSLEDAAMIISAKKSKVMHVGGWGFLVWRLPHEGGRFTI